MPQINRIRIINFSYNNNNRHIVDETFDFYQGENALLSLKNGGGKSVLVQLLLQPIIPKTKLMSRRIEDFFKGKKTPTYILIEWKLEDQGGYLLTGIGLANRESQVRDQDEINNNLKYFTFTSNYRTSNLFDIENIPLIKKQREKIYIEEYKEARKMIFSKERDITFRIKSFTDEDRLEYSKHLASYNISQDEWRSIVLKINESEGGVIEIFEKCRTSQQLMNDWILKTVEKVVNKEDEDQRKLEQMLENLVEEMITNEQFIHEKEIYEEFLRDSNDYLEKLNELVISIGKEEDLEDKIARMYYYLKNEISKMIQEMDTENEKIQSSEKELDNINLEERSREYYDVLKKVNELTERYEDESKKLTLLRERIKGNKKGALVQKAAREYEYIKGLRQILAGVEEEINKIKNSDGNNEKIRNLEYSLKIGYGKALEELNKEKIDVTNRAKDIDSILNQYKNRINEIDDSKSDLQNKKGITKGHIETFEIKEKKIKNKLQLTYTRNLLGEIEDSYKEKYLDIFDKKIVRLNGERESTLTEIEKSREKITVITEEVNQLRSNNNKNIIETTKFGDKIENYYSLEESIKPVYDKYELNWNRRFNHEENQLFIQNRMNELHKTEKDLDLNVRSINENIISLKNGTLHVSKEFREFLINKEIAFETGENYLRKQSGNIRDNLINQNPILPFSFILYDEDIESLKGMDFGLNIYQMVPILSYRDINNKYVVDGNVVQFMDKLHFMCLYDNKMIDANNLNSYLEELTSELDSAKEQHAHYKEEIETAGEELRRLKRFTFERNHIYDLERENERIESNINKSERQMEELNKKKEDIINKIDEYKDKIYTIDNDLKKTNQDIEEFNLFIKEDESYLKNRQLYISLSDEIMKLIKEKEKINNSLEEINRVKEDVLRLQIELGNRISDKRDRFEKYKNSQEGVLIEEELDIMEARLDTLKKEITSSLERLETDQGNKQKELKDKEDTIREYNLEESEYVDVIYDSQKLDELQGQIRIQEEEERKADKTCRDIESNLNRVQGKLESAEKEVKKLAELPIDHSLIKSNFNIRRKEEKEVISEAKKKIKELGENSKEYQQITNRIEGRIDINKHEVDISYVIENSPYEDYKRLTKELNVLKKENEVYKENANKQYHQIRADYKDRNKHIENIFSGLDTLITGAENDKNKYYYLGERILLSNDSLNKLIGICEQRLSNLEKNKKDMIQHSYLHGKQIYDEIQKIAENSSIKLEGKSRPMPMLKIKMLPLEENEEANSTKMKGYIEDCINIIKKDMKEDKKIEDIRKKISRYMSTRELLNVLSDLGKMNIFAYKIDINLKNSGYKTWEQVMKENSGGERFVSFFAVLVALMSYTRTSMKFEDDYQRNKDTKVLIMDNPFGPISSEHLLKPLFKIANKYNTQLICLTDLKQNSILNCFNLIYMIKIRQNVFGTSEYIQLEQQIKEDATVEKDEMLEKAVFKAEDIEQISLL